MLSHWLLWIAPINLWVKQIIIHIVNSYESCVYNIHESVIRLQQKTLIDSNFNFSFSRFISFRASPLQVHFEPPAERTPSSSEVCECCHHNKSKHIGLNTTGSRNLTGTGSGVGGASRSMSPGRRRDQTRPDKHKHHSVSPVRSSARAKQVGVLTVRF